MPAIFTQTNKLFQPLQVNLYSQLGSGSSRNVLRKDLLFFLKEQKKSSSNYLSLLAVFEEDEFSAEEFEAALWRELWFLTELEDSQIICKAEFSNDNLNLGYYLEIAGNNLFVKTHYSKNETDSIYPTLVFNVMSQLNIHHRISI